MAVDWRQKIKDLSQQFSEQADLDVSNYDALRQAQAQKQASDAAAAQKAAEDAVQAKITASQAKTQQNFNMIQLYGAKPNSTGQIQNTGGSVPYTGSSRSALAGMKPGANLTTINTKGGRVTVNKQYAAKFKGFIDELAGIYGIKSLGGYANRNIAGTNTTSLHAYGLAIDINPGSNPVSHGRVITNLPPHIAELAAKYGLYWGGNWQGSKKDPMHFSALISG